MDGTSKADCKFCGYDGREILNPHISYCQEHDKQLCLACFTCPDTEVTPHTIREAVMRSDFRRVTL